MHHAILVARYQYSSPTVVSIAAVPELEFLTAEPLPRLALGIVENVQDLVGLRLFHIAIDRSANLFLECIESALDVLQLNPLLIVQRECVEHFFPMERIGTFVLQLDLMESFGLRGVEHEPDKTLSVLIDFFRTAEDLRPAPALKYLPKFHIDIRFDGEDQLPLLSFQFQFSIDV